MNGDDDEDTTPEDVSERQSERILAFLNSATTPREIADTVEFRADEETRRELARAILEERGERNGFTNLSEVSEVPGLDSERFTDVVRTLGEELVPTPAEEAQLRGVAPRHQLSLMKLQRHEDAVVERLGQDEELATLFLKNPAQALARMGVPVDSALKKRLEARRPERPDRERTFCLPNGQEITPNVNVRFVRHERTPEEE